MIQKKLLSSLSIIVLIVFVISLFSTANNVRADEGTPPPPTEEATDPPTEDTDTQTVPAETELAPSETELAPIETEVVPAETEPAPTETPELDTVEEILDAAPEGVDVVVLDENGEALPLATEEAASIILQGDPVWCPDGQTPGTDLDDFVQDCTDPETTFTDLLTNLSGGAYTGDGTIYISWDYAATEGGILFDHDTTSGLLGLDDITFQGGWDFGTDALKDDDPTYKSLLAGTTLTITDWVGNVTVNNLFIDAQAGGNGLVINTAGDVDLNYVIIENADDWGLLVGAGGNVELNDVSVEDSTWTGADIGAAGNVEINNSSFSYNGYSPDTSSSGSIPSYTYNESYGNGLTVSAGGNITLDTVYSGYNAYHGAQLQGQNVTVIDSIFEYNGTKPSYKIDIQSDESSYWTVETLREAGTGLYIDANGEVTLQGVYAHHNYGYGAYLDTDGNILVEESEFSNNGALGSFYLYYDLQYDGSEFKTGTEYVFPFFVASQAYDGLYADGEGNITLQGVIANENANYGAYVYASGTGDLAIIDSNFNQNGYGLGLFDDEFSGDGYSIIYDWLVDNGDDLALCEVLGDLGFSYQPVVFNPCTNFNDMEAFAPNFSFGVDVAGNTDTNDYANSYFIEQHGGTGLYAETHEGVLTAENVIAIYNSDVGAHLDGEFGASLDVGGFVGNGSIGHMLVEECYQDFYPLCSPYGAEGYDVSIDLAYGDGLYMESDYGPVTLSSVGASANYNNGAVVDAEESYVEILSGTFIANGVMLTLGGDYDPVTPLLDGSLGYFDPYLCDQFGFCSETSLPFSQFQIGYSYYAGGGGVSEFDSADFSSGKGLDVDAKGDITLFGGGSVFNLGDGANLLSLLGNIDVQQMLFVLNGYGLNGAGTYGYYEYPGTTGETEYYTLYNGSGLVATATNDITLYGVASVQNTLYGADLYSGALLSVFVEESVFDENGFVGYLGPGIIEGEYHLEFDDGSAPVSQLITWEYSGSGLYIESQGNITLNYVNANNNYYHGAELYSYGGKAVVNCGVYDNNGYGAGQGYGVYEQGASSLALYGPEILNNFFTPDEYFFSSSLIISPDCLTPEEVSLTAGCFDELPHLLLVLNDENEPNGDYVIFPCPLNGTPSVIETHEENLPGPLPDFKPDEEGGEAIYRSALRTELDREGELVSQNEKLILVSFLIPEGVDVESLTILRWTGEEWVDVGGTLSDIGPDGLVEEGKQYLKTSTFDLGFFALVSK